jgi:kinesin family member 5
MIEIYNEKIRDLIDPVKTDLKIKEDRNKGVFVDGATELKVFEEAEIY